MTTRAKLYKIMHKDRHVASLRSDGSCTVYYPSFLPYDLYLEPDACELDERLNNLEDFYHWCASRLLTLDRTHAKAILNSIGAKQAVTDRDRAEISLRYRCLSFTDVFWVSTGRGKVRYEEINLYENSLSNAFVDVSLRGAQLTAQNAQLLTPEEVAGDIATAGAAPKAWIREKGTFWLLKDGERRDVEAELLASRIAGCFDVRQVKYMEDRYAGVKVSRSELMTSGDMGIVPMEAVEIYALNRGEDREQMTLRRDPYAFHMMNVIDYLTGNPDRHWGNWGFSVDNRTNKLMELHPLMDFNKAFLAYDTLDGALCQTFREKISQREAAVRGVRCVGLNQICEVRAEWFAELAAVMGFPAGADPLWEMFCARLALLREAM